MTSLRTLIARDLRHAIRVFHRAPGFASVVVLTLAVGLGATTSVFSLIDGVLLRPLPVRDPQRLVTISSQTDISQGRPAGSGWSYAMWERLRARVQAFDGALAWRPTRLNLAPRGEMQFADGLITTSEYFHTLGVPAILGRTFTAADDRRGGGSGAPVVVISYGFWQRQLGGSDDAIGKPLFLEGVPFTIAGVTPAGFSGVEVGRSFDVALTFGAEPLIHTPATIDQPDAFGLIPMLRLRPGQSLAEATDALRALQPEIVGPTSRLPPSLDQPLVLVPAPTGTSAAGVGMSGVRQRYRQPLVLLMAIAGALLVSACASVANLVWIRAAGRVREFSVRLALGASRVRLAAQLLVESVILGVAGAVGGLVLAQWTTAALTRQMSLIDASVALDAPFGWRLFAFVAVATLGAFLIIGVVPAFSTARQAGLNPAMTHGTPGASRSRSGPVSALVVAQVALSVVLLLAAGVLARTVSALAAVPLGFDERNVLLVTVDTSRASLSGTSRLPLFSRLVAAVVATPGVAAAAGSSSVPISGGFGQLRVHLPAAPATEVMTVFSFVSPGWFATYGTAFAAGRDFDAGDSATGTPVVIVNEALARSLFADEDPIGRPVAGGPAQWPARIIVGVVHDAVFHSMKAHAAGSALRDPAAPTMYLPLSQAEGMTPPDMTRITIGVRPVAGRPSQLAGRVAASLAAADATVSYSFRPLADVVSAAFAQERLVSMLASVCGGLALLLAAAGLYGVSSHAVSLRRTEIGIRIALGATSRATVGLIVGRAATLTALGLVEGTILSFWTMDGVASVLFGVSATDPMVVLAALVTVSVIALAAGALPAWRATRIDPVETLRVS